MFGQIFCHDFWANSLGESISLNSRSPTWLRLIHKSHFSCSHVQYYTETDLSSLVMRYTSSSETKLIRILTLVTDECIKTDLDTVMASFPHILKTGQSLDGLVGKTYLKNREKPKPVNLWSDNLSSTRVLKLESLANFRFSIKILEFSEGYSSLNTRQKILQK